MKHFEIYKGKVRRELPEGVEPKKGFKVGSYADPEPKYNKLEQYIEWVQEYDSVKKQVHLSWKVHPRNEQKIFERKKDIVKQRIEEGFQAQLRFEIEYQGNTFGASQITLEAMHSAYILAVSYASYFCNWKSDTGFVTLNADQIKELYRMIQERIFAVYKKKDDLLDQVEAATSETIDDLYFARTDYYEVL